MHKQLSKRWMALMLITGMLTLGMMGMAQAQSADGPSSLTETYQSWRVNCVMPAAIEGQAAPTRICEMMQELRQQNNGQRLLTMALQPAQEGASLTILAPFGLLLSEGVKITVAGEAVAQGGFRTCLPGGCVSIISLTQGALDTFSAGDTATITMLGTNGQEIALAVSLAGFAAAWNRLNGI